MSIKRGFTLIEILVALVLIAVITAVVAPVVLQQINRYHAFRAARDLNSLRSSLRAFNGNTLTFPRYLDLLVNQPVSSSDSTVYQRFFTTREADSWIGPYADFFADKAIRTSSFGGVPMRTGFDGRVMNRLQCISDANTLSACTLGAYLAIRVEGLNGLQFDLINAIVDGDESTDPVNGTSEARSRGRLRFVIQIGSDYALSQGVMFYFVIPLSK